MVQTLPGIGRSRALDAFGEVRSVPFDSHHADASELSALVARETGVEVDLSRGRSWQLAAADPEDVMARVRDANLAIARSEPPAR